MEKKCIVCTIKYIKQVNCSKKKWANRRFCSRSCAKIDNKNRLGISYPAWNKGVSNPNFQGENNPNWKGGITPINRRIRTSKEYKDWRVRVLKRDNYTCVECGSNGVSLQVDHIKPFAYFPELRLVIENGRTLCIPCHENTDTYTWKALKYKEKIT